MLFATLIVPSACLETKLLSYCKVAKEAIAKAEHYKLSIIKLQKLSAIKL